MHSETSSLIPPGSRQMRATPHVSIIMPVRNEEKVIGKCLDALCALDYPRDFLQVIVVDNGSTDATVRIAESFSDRLNVSVLHRPGVRISALRNAGAQVATGEVLAFLDADCLPRRDWLKNAADILLEHPRAVVGSDYLIPECSSWVARAWFEEDLPEFARVRFIPSGDLIVRADVFAEIGGFNEAIQTNEDCEFCMRARQANVPVYGAEKLAVIHLGTPQTVSHFLRKQRWHGTHVFRVFRQNLGAMQNAKPIAFALFTLLATVAVLASLGLFIWNGAALPLVVSSAALLGGPAVLAMQKAVARHRPLTFFPLGALFLVYGFARALSLLNPKNW